MASDEPQRMAILEDLLKKTSQPSFAELGHAVTCMICHEPYLSGDTPELPLKLSCGHVTGSHCLLRWMSPLSANGSNSCPLCRTPILETEHNGVNANDTEEERVSRMIYRLFTTSESVNALSNIDDRRINSLDEFVWATTPSMEELALGRAIMNYNRAQPKQEAREETRGG